MAKKKLSQLEAVQLVGIERAEYNRVLPLTDKDVDKLIRRGLVELSGSSVALTKDGREALRRWLG